VRHLISFKLIKLQTLYRKLLTFWQRLMPSSERFTKRHSVNYYLNQLCDWVRFSVEHLVILGKLWRSHCTAKQWFSLWSVLLLVNFSHKHSTSKSISHHQAEISKTLL